MADVTREEFERLQRRIEQLEARTGLALPDGPRCPLCGHVGRKGDRFCVECGSEYVRAPAPAPAPVAYRPPVPAPAATATFEQVVRPAPTPPPEPARERPKVSLETMLGQRAAPRIGAVLVFLGAVFFLGLGIQRGWVTPWMQLGIAAAAAGALIVWGEILTRRRGYGTYPQVVEATGICVLYVAAFVAHALPYYREATGLTALGSGLLMAIVAAGALALAVWRSARSIAALSYTLGFLTAGVGWGVLPTLTVAYVAILGSSLAALVLWKRWLLEAAIGTVVTGLFLYGLSLSEDVDGLVVAFVGLVPATAFVALTLVAPRDVDRGDARTQLLPAIALVSLGWLLALAMVARPWTSPQQGVVLLGACAVATVLALVASQRPVARGVTLAYAGAAFVLYLAWPTFLWSDLAFDVVAVSVSYAAGAIVLLVAQRRRSPPIWQVAALLAGAAGFAAFAGADDLSFVPTSGAPLLGPWQAFVELLAIGGAFVLLQAMAPPTLARAWRALALVAGAAFVALWGFALFSQPILTTLVILGVAGGLVYWGTRPGSPVAREAGYAGLVLLAVAGLKAAILDIQVGNAAVPMWVAAVDAAAVAIVLLLVFHQAPREQRLDAAVGAVLVGGSAAVVASFVFGYAQGAWVSTLLALEGVAYLGAGFVLRKASVYRYVGFALLGVVLVRLFLVDLSQADLAVRALVFLALGGILLGIGFVYARMSRKTPEP